MYKRCGVNLLVAWESMGQRYSSSTVKGLGDATNIQNSVHVQYGYVLVRVFLWNFRDSQRTEGQKVL